jgi:ornithine carbamoyltransferase
MVTQMKHLLSLLEYNESEFVKVLELAEKIKSDWTKGKRPDLLPRKVLGLIFEKPSLRTRVSFESAMMQMGGNSIFLGTSILPAQFVTMLTQLCSELSLMQPLWNLPRIPPSL